MTEPKVRIEDLRKTYGEEVAVDGLSTVVKTGQLKSLLGPSGCGKTTTLRCIAGLERPDAGKIYIDDELVSAPEEGIHLDPQDRGIGMVFQSYAVWPHMTVEGNVGYPLKAQGIGTKAERRERVEEVLSLVGLDAYAESPATDLSGGQQQRVAIARALAVEPDVLLFDEPLSNLDAKLRRDMRLEIKELYEKLNITILYVTHAQDEAMFLSDEIALMLDGKIIEEADPTSLHTRPQNFFSMDFMGHNNSYLGALRVGSNGHRSIETELMDFEVAEEEEWFEPDREVYVCFRPKICDIERADGGPADGEAFSFTGVLEMTSPTRDFTEYRVDVGDLNVLVRTPEPKPLQPGDTVRVSVPRDEVRVFDRASGGILTAY